MSISDGIRWVCLTGGDGSGKSTQAAAVVAALHSEGVEAVEVGIWDGLADPTTSALLPFRNKGQVQDYLRVLRPQARGLFLFHALRTAIDLASDKKPQIAILNAHWYKYYASEIAIGGNPTEIRAWTIGFPVPDRTYYLRVEPTVALQRKSEVSSYESGFGGVDSFLRVQTVVHRELDALSTELGWREMDGTEDRGVLTDQICEELLGWSRA